MSGSISAGFYSQMPDCENWSPADLEDYVIARPIDTSERDLREWQKEGINYVRSH